METDIVVSEVRLGSLSVTSPEDVIQRASSIAKDLANIVENRKLYSLISGKKYVRVEGWETLGAMLGVLPREVEGKTVRYEDGTYEATVELIRVGDGAIIGRGSAICGMDEPTWSKRLEYARRSMAITRATGKAYRLSFSWIMTLAGYEPTPAEEMVDIVEGQVVEQGQRSQNNGKDRPYPPEKVRDRLLDKVKKHNDFQPTDKQIQLLRYGLELCFAGQESVEDKRHSLLHFLTGVTSTKSISGSMFKAIVEDWLKMSQDSGDEYRIDPMAAKEAQMIVNAALVGEGQQTLL